jgi:CRP/FNR family transcriptional regulator
MMPTATNSVCRVCPFRDQSVFADLPDHRLDEFCRLKLVSRYQTDQRIFYEGEPNLGLSILCSGKVKLSRTSPSGKPQALNIVGPCGLLGEPDLFSADRHTVSAEALEDSVVGFVKKEDFFAFLADNATVALRIIQRLSTQLTKTEVRSFALTSLDVKQRLAALLLELAEQHGTTALDGRVIDVPLTREDLADMVGATPETVIRVLSAFRKDGVVKDASRQLVVLRPDELRRIAES